jgi:hypothetical protein
MTRRTTLPYSACLVLLLISGCGPKSKIVADWKAPDVQPEAFTKVIAVATSQDKILRRIAEDEFVRRLPKGTQGVTAYSLISEEIREDQTAVRSILEKAGVDGAVVFRMTGVDTNLEYSPGTAHYNFWGYYGWAWSATYAPDYMKWEKTVKVEASVYRVSDEKLVWSAISQSTDPESAKNVIDDVAKLVAKRMQQAGLVQ